MEHAGIILGRQLTEGELGQFHNYLKILRKWQKVQRLVGSIESRWVADHLFLDSLLFSRVTSMDDESGRIMEVRLAVGAATLTARVTRRSVQQLDIRVGQDLFALVKAVSFDQRSVGYA